MNIAIRYNPDTGFEDAALALARRIFARYDEAIDSLALVPVDDEDLALHLNGLLIHSATQTGRLPLVADLRNALAAPAPEQTESPRN